MIFRPPKLDSVILKALEEIGQIRKQVRFITGKRRRWSGMLRRMMLAGAIRGSNSIEGYKASVEDALAAMQHEEPFDTSGETWLALTGFRNAMTFVLQLAPDPSFKYETGIIRSLHYMMVNYDLSKNPGNWRPGSISVRDEAKNETVYEAPDREMVEPLMAELIKSLNDSVGFPEIVRAAMAHLNLVMIHPFSDGNGRMARCLQTLVLAREGILEPEFCSIEEHLGRIQHDYYEALAEVGQGSWHPENDTRNWLQFVLRAHLYQAHRVLWVNDSLSKVWQKAEEIAGEKKLPERTAQAISDAIIGLKLRNSSYRNDAAISDNLASRDLKLLVDAGIIIPSGQKRGRHYVPSPKMKKLREQLIAPFKPPDRFDVIPNQVSLFED